MSPGHFTPAGRAATANGCDIAGHAPLLVAGTADHIVPAAVVRENHRRSTALTEYREHSGWEVVADDALDWAPRAR
ncbi:hypothetical protein [Streptomyces sp. NPDC001537]